MAERRRAGSGLASDFLDAKFGTSLMCRIGIDENDAAGFRDVRGQFGRELMPRDDTGSRRPLGDHRRGADAGTVIAAQIVAVADDERRRRQR